MTPNPKPSPELLAEQVLELLSEHISSNDRVVAAVEKIENTLPKEADRILKDHRESLANLPPPVAAVPNEPADLPALKRYLSEAIHLWGAILTVLLVLSSCTLLFFILHR